MEAFAADGDFTQEYVETYDQTRAHYPQQIITLLESEIQFNSDWLVADIGCGTGLLSSRFAAHGNQVRAVEKSVRMRDFVGKKFAAAPNFKIAAGTAADTTLADSSIDLIAAGHAFHQFNVEECRKEFLRILKPAGWVMLIWNYLKVSGSQTTESFAKLLREYKAGGGDMAEVTRASAEKLFVAGFRDCSLDNNLQLDLENARRFILMHRASPFADDLEVFDTALSDFFEEFSEGKKVKLDFSSLLYLGRADKLGASEESS